MTPNILKSHTDTSKFNGQKADTPANDPNNNNYSNYNPAPKSGPSSNMPTDASNRSGQALDAGASAGNQALNAETPLHENASKQVRTMTISHTSSLFLLTRTLYRAQHRSSVLLVLSGLSSPSMARLEVRPRRSVDPWTRREQSASTSRVMVAWVEQ